MWFPATPGWGPVVVLRSPVALHALPPLPLGWVALRATPLVSAPGLPGLWLVCGEIGWGGGGGGGLDAGSVPFPCHLGPLTNGPGRIPPYCVCSAGPIRSPGGPPYL